MSSDKFTPGNDEEIAEEKVQEQLERILSSSRFIASPSLSQFLQFVVTETLAGREGRIKEYTIAVQAWGRERDFDPQTDPIVRIQAGRLRRALREYYADEASNDSIHIELPKGTYIPRYKRVAVTSGPEKVPATEALFELDEPVVAVLPLRNLSGDASQAPFVDGFGEELAGNLSRFRPIAVIAYYSCRRFRDTTEDVREIARQLGADFIVTGSFFRNETRLRISFALNDAHNGFLLWGQRFDRELTISNFFDVQDEIIEQIVAAIGSSYGVMPRLMAKAAQDKRTENLSVYEAVLQRTTFLMNVSPKAHREAKQALERAVMVDPNYAPAWAALGGMYATAHLLDVNGQDNLVEQALECVNQALRLDPLCQDAYSVLANVHLQRRDRAGVIRACQRMLGVNPNDASNVGIAGFWMALAGDEDEGLALLDKAIDLNPFYPGWFHFPYFLHHFARGEYDQAYVRSLDIKMPGLFWDPLLRTAASSQIGRIVEAQTALHELLQLKPDFPNHAHHHLGRLILVDELRGQLLSALYEAGLPDVEPST